MTNATVKAKVVKNQKDGKSYLLVDSFAWNIGVDGYKFGFTNLFGGNKVLGAMANKFFNDNSMEIFSTMKHLPEQAFGYLFKDYSNIIFQYFPFDELLPR